MATFYSAKVAEDQLQQSRDGEDEDKRKQASRLNYWVQGSSLTLSDKKRILHVVNRSLDPVYVLTLRIKANEIKGWGDDIHHFTLVVMETPPCSELIFPAAELKIMSFEWAGRKFLADAKGGWHVELAAFVDREGAIWQRDQDGIEETDELPDAETGSLLGEPHIRKAQKCTDETM
ncbi:hypothetical protein [Streptomyces sp. NPDC047070]|uniref:hypothetical protein n=1 Tax=Streptomyces sp. NPDC047070 TaxID=3154923 RepID=UPI003453A79F